MAKKQDDGWLSQREGRHKKAMKLGTCHSLRAVKDVVALEKCFGREMALGKVTGKNLKSSSRSQD